MGINSVYTWIGDALAGKGYVVVVVRVPNITGSDVQQWADSIKDGISYLQMQHSGSSDLAGMVSGCSERQGTRWAALHRCWQRVRTIE